MEQVRLVDQEKINEFGKLNNRLLEIRADIKQHKADVEKLDDATAELVMSAGGTVMLYMGESFIETTEDFATECKPLLLPSTHCMLLIALYDLRL